ncbi:sensor histidine kinase [Deinococcus marmoris]|uniref:ATP-binding protein n=1 Tax=Deinococcus marmoris TaxID=249408 RepID=UPI00138DF8A1|nr:sensor histidine kinase [Deinococcus marmoris]
MTIPSDNQGHLRFAPDILKRLGEELIPNPEQGLIELVKNSYDADANRCEISLTKVSRRGGSIVIKDDGKGMTVDDILSGFFMIGRSRKAPRVKRKNGRLTVGDKGLGRLAALRLGSSTTIISRPKSEPGIEHTTTIDWAQIDLAEAIEDIKLSITSLPTKDKSGTEIYIDQITNPLNTEDVARLTRELVLLKDPFETSDGFDVVLISKEFQEYVKRVNESYFEFANYRLVASVGKNGEGIADVYDSSGQILFSDTIPHGKSKKYKMPPAKFELWVWILSSEYFNEKTVKLPEIREWLKSIGGVHIYHRGIRVRPYGDPGFDWLDMNLARARRPEERPSTNNVIGRVIINDPKLRLDQPTNRIGFIENEVFNEVRRFAKDSLEWMGKERLKIAEARRESEKRSAPAESKNALQSLRAAVKSASQKDEKRNIEDALETFVKVKNSEMYILQDELQLYRSLATAGTTSAVFAHESSKPITVLKSSANTLERRGRKIAGERYDAQLKEPINRIRSVSNSLSSYSKFPIFHLVRRKRKITEVDLRETWQTIAELFTPLLQEAQISFSIEPPQSPCIINGSIAMIESIATNLLTNSIYALTKRGATMVERQVNVKIIHQGTTARIIHSDNGRGIQNIDIEKIWNPGETTSNQGTGFGLTIVRDSVSDLNGSVAVIPSGSLGGAEFFVTLPIK